MNSNSWLPTRLVKNKGPGKYKEEPCRCSKCICTLMTSGYVLLCAACKVHNPRPKRIAKTQKERSRTYNERHSSKVVKAALMADPRLDEFELRILEELCKTGKSYSSVVLSSDLYGTTEEVQETRPLEWFLVEQLLEDLNRKGLVVYRLGAYDLFVQIRPTQAAYEALHIERRWLTFVGHGWHSRQEHAVHPGDVTDFRSFGQVAKGGAIIREDFIDHCISCGHFPIHRDQLIELYGSDKL